MRLSEQLLRDHNCGDFGRALEGYSERAKQLDDIVEAVAHIGVDFGYGEFQLTTEHIDLARKLISTSRMAIRMDMSDTTNMALANQILFEDPDTGEELRPSCDPSTIDGNLVLFVASRDGKRKWKHTIHTEEM